MDLLADTCFLIDIWREARNPGPATRFARLHADRQVGICWIVEGEFLGGTHVAGQDVVSATAFLSKYPVVQSSSAISSKYGEIFASMRRRNRLLGPHDLWIAAVALTTGIPLITRNTADFAKVDGLKLVDYTHTCTAPL